MRDLAGSLHEQRHAQGAEGLQKTAVDLARYRKVIERTEPNGIVEIGTAPGMSALWFATTAACPVLTVDVHHDELTADLRARAEVAGVEFYLGRSIKDETVAYVHHWAAGRDRVMVSLDGDHSASTVLGELQAYASIVGPDCYLVVEDGVVRWLPEIWPHYHGGPLDAIEVWLMTHGNEWEVDSDIEDLYSTTQFPKGWLRRR